MLEYSKKTNLLEQKVYKYSLQDVAEPNLYRDLYPYEEPPKISFNHRRVRNSSTRAELSEIPSVSAISLYGRSSIRITMILRIRSSFSASSSRMRSIICWTASRSSIPFGAHK